MKKKKSSFRSLNPIDFSDALNKELSSINIEDNLGKLSSKSKNKLFLRSLTAEDLRAIMIKIGLVEHLEKIGLDDLIIKIDVDSSLINYLKIFYKEEKTKNLLLELRLSETKFVPDKKFLTKPDEIITYDMIVIEWLSAQNPLENFKNNKPQLPGQKKPGLGILKYCFEMMYIVAKEIIKDGFLDIPDHFHGAVMYSKKFKFYDPAHEGVLKALMRDLKEYSLNDISWGMMTETIIEQYSNKPQPYDPSEQIFYVSDRMRRYFHSNKYKSTYNKYYKRKKFKFNYDEMVKKREEILKLKKIVEL